MSKITFSKENIELLKQNPYVAKVSEKSITYSDEFKRLFIDEYLKGKTPRIIFEEAGFDISILGVRRYEQAAARWLRIYNDNGIIGLRDTRKENSGRPTTINKLMAEHKDSLSKDAFIHSDQGVHYTSPKFQSLLKENTLGQSMSSRGNCWDNAPQESFFGHMKDEVDFKSFQTFDEVLKAIDDYIEYYNNYRYQWNLKKMTPKQYRNHLLLAS